MGLVFRLLVVICGVLAGAARGEAQAEKRVALVIGNSAYLHTRALVNPRHDAEAVAEALRDLGFADAAPRLDLDYRALREAVRLFGQAAQEADVAIVYYAGHGLEVAGENYLVPVDAQLLRHADLEYEAVTLASVLTAASGARRLRLVVLDACRNNPLGEKIVLKAGVTRSVTRGLARVEPAGDILVAYAAKAGTLAEDGAGKHSPFAEALLKHVATPGLDVRLMFGKVRDQVLVATRQQQEPYTYGSLSGDVVALVPISVPAEGAPLSPLISEAEHIWGSVKDSRDIAALEIFIRRYGNTFHGDLAKARVAALKAEVEAERLKMLQREEDRKLAESRARLAELKAAAEGEQLRALEREEERKRAEIEPTRVFDGHWYSPEWKYGYRLRDGIGIASSTNSPKFKVGDVIIRIRAVGSKTFEGQQVYRDGRWYHIRGELRSDGRIYIDGEKNVSWFMTRTD
jgi:Caspase domain